MGTSPKSRNSAYLNDVPTRAVLANRDVDPQAIMMTYAGKVLAAKATDPDIPWKVSEMSKATGLAEAEVRALYQQPWFYDMLQSQALNKAGLLLEKCLGAIDEVLENPDSQKLKLDAAKAGVNAYETLLKCAPKQDDDDAAKQFDKLLGNLKKTTAKVIVDTKEVEKESIKKKDK